MSILLEALRKSEKQKHLGHAPSIHSTADLELRRPARWKPGIILLVLLPVILVLAWFGFQQNRNIDNPEPARGGAEAEPAATVAEREPPPLQKQRPAISSSPAVNEETGTDRTPVESFDPGDRVVSADSSPAAPEEGLQLTDQEAAADTEEASTPPGAANLQRVQQSAPGTVPGQDGSDASQEPATDSYRSPEFSVITYWRLPEAIREQISVPRISVLVFSERPEDRFILMNGTRLIEGDEPQPGLVLEEIRRDGAVFSYRLYRFLVSS